MTAHTDNAATLSGSRHFAERLAAHLADVKNSDAAHRLVSTPAEQKLEAVVRMLSEVHSENAALRDRLAGVPRRVAGATGRGDPSVSLETVRIDALLEAVSTDEPEDEDSVA